MSSLCENARIVRTLSGAEVYFELSFGFNRWFLSLAEGLSLRGVFAISHSLVINNA